MRFTRTMRTMKYTRTMSYTRSRPQTTSAIGMGRGGFKTQEKIADVVYGWSPRPRLKQSRRQFFDNVFTKGLGFFDSRSYAYPTPGQQA